MNHWRAKKIRRGQKRTKRFLASKRYLEMMQDYGWFFRTEDGKVGFMPSTFFPYY